MIYTIHMRPNARPHPLDGEGLTVFDELTAIPESVAKWGLIFPPFWLAYHKLWWAFVAYGLIAFLGIGLLATPYWLVMVVLGGFPGLYLFLEGNQLRRQALEAKGFELVSVVEAGDERIALARFVSTWECPAPAKSPSLPVLPSQSSHSSFGMFPQGEG